MNNHKYEYVSGSVFGTIAALQAARAVLKAPAHVASYDVPVSASWVAALIASGLCAWAFHTARQQKLQ